MGGGSGGNFGNTRGSEYTTSSSLPTKGKSNSSIVRLNKDGKIISKHTYDSEGRAKEDIDYTDHGNPKTHPKVPHKHKWNWDNPDKPRRSNYDE